MELSVNLEFNQELNEFRYQCIQPENEGGFKTVCRDISFTDAQMFVIEIRETFPNPILFVSVVCQWNAWKLKNKI